MRGCYRLPGALLIYGGGEGCSIGIVTGQQAALVEDPESTIGELANDDRAADEMRASRVVGSCRIVALKVTALLLRTRRSCLADSSRSRSIPASGVKAL